MAMSTLRSRNLPNTVVCLAVNLEDMQAGASERVDVEVEKKHPF